MDHCCSICEEEYCTCCRRMAIMECCKHSICVECLSERCLKCKLCVFRHIKCPFCCAHVTITNKTFKYVNTIHFSKD